MYYNPLKPSLTYLIGHTVHKFFFCDRMSSASASWWSPGYNPIGQNASIRLSDLMGHMDLWGASLTAPTPPSVQETQLRSLGWKDPQEKGMAIHPTILAWRIPWTEEPGGLQSMQSQKVGHNWATNTNTYGFMAPWAVYPRQMLVQALENHWGRTSWRIFLGEAWAILSFPIKSPGFVPSLKSCSWSLTVKCLYIPLPTQTNKPFSFTPSWPIRVFLIFFFFFTIRH